MADVLVIVVILAFFGLSALVVRWLGRVVAQADQDAEAAEYEPTQPEREPEPGRVA